MSQSLQTQTTSIDSIGSCSLDVNATGTTSPATMEVFDGSEHTLRSVSLENKLSEVGDSEVVTPVRPVLRPQPFTDPGPPPPRDSFKTPSYLGISCAVNGYNRLNRYDSALREGFRSRDASPARLAFSRSRDSSPMRPEWKGFDTRAKASPQATAAKIKELKEELAKFKAEFPQPPGERGRQNLSKRLGRRPSQGRSISVDRGYLVKATPQEIMNGHNTPDSSRVHHVEITMEDNTSTSVRSSSYQYSYEERTVRSDGMETTVTCTTHTNGDTPNSKSFIQSRIERLYGPSALGSGFRSRRSLLELEKEQKDREAAGHWSPSVTTHSDNHYDPDARAPEGFPSVFRHLRPEFRTQLQVKRNTGHIKTGFSPTQVESPKRPGRVIPITLTDTIENKPSKPPIIHPKPDLPINNDIQRRDRDREIKPVVVQKIVNGNGNIEERKVAVSKEPSVNGSVGEDWKRGSNDVVVTVQDATARTNNVKSVSESVKVNGNVSGEVEKKDGHYFLKVVEDVVSNIESKVAQIDSYLELSGSDMSEEVRGKVLAAVGKARLLVSQKIQQFQGLCHKNIIASESEEFPTTCEDLAGFWDMVSIQVEDIRQLLQEIETLRSNNWQEVQISTDTIDGTEVTVSTGKARRKPAPRPCRPAKSTKTNMEKTGEGKSRDEARRKLMEERRKAMKEAMRAKKAEAEARKAEAGEDAVEIFVPEGK